jgi:hypothetical protein
VKKYIFLVLLAAVAIFYFRHSTRKIAPESSDTIEREESPQMPPEASAKSVETSKESVATPSASLPKPTAAPALATQKEKPANSAKLALPYVMEDGLVVVQGDLVVGTPVQENADETGWVEMPSIQLWPTRMIPIYIDPSVQNPERVKEALEMFQGTAIQFVPFNNQKDAIAFIDGTGTCKSYVGKVGGHQPILLPVGCGAKEIAHEVMHALGFVHEQNRADRDQYLQMNFDNIDERYKDNFEKLPPEFMKANGVGNFDFQSILMYPTWMFAKNSGVTMQSRTGQAINPSPTLSRTDIERINRIYGNR